MPTLNAALYVRVSTAGQEDTNQERELLAWAGRLGLEVVQVIPEVASGARGDRAGLKALLEGAHQRQYDTVLIWALDRLTREGSEATFRYLRELRRTGVIVRSLQDSWLATENDLVWEILVGVFGALARAERERISARVKAGLDRVRERGSATGRPIGRPPTHVTAESIRALVSAGYSLRATASALGSAPSTVARVAKGHGIRFPGKHPFQKPPHVSEGLYPMSDE